MKLILNGPGRFCTADAWGDGMRNVRQHRVIRCSWITRLHHDAESSLETGQLLLAPRGGSGFKADTGPFVHCPVRYSRRPMKFFISFTKRSCKPQDVKRKSPNYTAHAPTSLSPECWVLHFQTADPSQVSRTWILSFGGCTRHLNISRRCKSSPTYRPAWKLNSSSQFIKQAQTITACIGCNPMREA